MNHKPDCPDYWTAARAAESSVAERYGWHADGDICLGAECMNTDENTGDHSTDVHSSDWWDGYTTAAARLKEPTE